MTGRTTGRVIGFLLGSLAAVATLVLIESLFIWTVLTVLVRIDFDYLQVVGAVIIIRTLRSSLLPPLDQLDQTNDKAS